MLTVLALVGVLVLGLALGLVWRGAVLIGDRRTLDRLASQLEAEQCMAAATHATLAAMRQTVRRGVSGDRRQ
ncbi:hypothetical protein [Blastococcus sp. TF02-09]|uniref:hypothetical protein n=1 Tax=Blastococcus sp. TF02-09 TaxID=2250576 RepID=UPI0011BF9978|nr:hypothetical protein [Blastococcus sp. TF02-9]